MCRVRGGAGRWAGALPSGEDDGDHGHRREQAQPAEGDQPPGRPPIGLEPEHGTGDPDHHERGRARERGVEPAADRFLEVDATVRLLGQERPRQPVDHECEPAEEGEDHERAADQERIDAEPARQAGRHATDPAVVRAHDAGAAQGVEEGVRAVGAGRPAGGGARWRRGRWRRGRWRRGRGPRSGGRERRRSAGFRGEGRCAAHAPSQPLAEVPAPSGTTLILP